MCIYAALRELRPEVAIHWDRAICIFVPFIQYIFAELVMDLVAAGAAAFALVSALPDAQPRRRPARSPCQVALDGLFGTGLRSSGTRLTIDLDQPVTFSASRFAPLGQAWLAWVSMSFVAFSVVLFRGYRTRRHLLPIVLGCVAYFAATISDFAVVTRYYDAHYVQHLGFAALVIGCWSVLAGRFELSLLELNAVVGSLEERGERSASRRSTPTRTASTASVCSRRASRTRSTTPSTAS